MRIAYLSFNCPYRSVGVHKKELSLCGALSQEAKSRGWCFKGFNITSGSPEKGRVPVKDHYEIRHVAYPMQVVVQKIKVVRCLVRDFFHARAGVDVIAGYRPDVLILRYGWFPFSSNPKSVFKDLFLLTEHNAKEGNELGLSLSGRMFKRPAEHLIFKRNFKDVDALIAVTGEIAKYEIRRGGEERPYFVLTNGLSVEEYKAKRYRKIEDGRLELLFIAAQDRSWHGLDRLLKGMSLYDGGTDVFLNVVGDVRHSCRKLVSSLGLGDNVLFHGRRYGSDLDEIFDRAHVAVGTLALHRKGLQFASPIKTREYLARGIPCAIAYKDEDIKDDYPYVLQMPSGEEPIDVPAIVSFAERVYDLYGERMVTEIRDYASAKIDYKVKVAKLLDFIESAYLERSRHVG